MITTFDHCPIEIRPVAEIAPQTPQPRTFTIRTMNCSREQEAIEAAGGAGTRGSSPKVITVVDLDKNAWRCFKPETVLSFTSLV